MWWLTVWVWVDRAIHPSMRGSSSRDMRESTIIFPHDISPLVGKKWNYGNCPTAAPLCRNRALLSWGFLWHWPSNGKPAKATILTTNSPSALFLHCLKKPLSCAMDSQCRKQYRYIFFFDNLLLIATPAVYSPSSLDAFLWRRQTLQDQGLAFYSVSGNWKTWKPTSHLQIDKINGKLIISLKI